MPVEALPGFLRLLSYAEPLRQVLSGTRSILYLDAQGVAGLTRGTVAAAAGLLFWLVVGAIVVRWYDRKGLYRLQPEVLAHVNQAVQDYRTKQAAPAPAPDHSDARRNPPPPIQTQAALARRADRTAVRQTLVASSRTGEARDEPALLSFVRRRR